MSQNIKVEEAANWVQLTYSNKVVFFKRAGDWLTRDIYVTEKKQLSGPEVLFIISLLFF